MNTDSKLPEIRKEAFIKARENLNLSTKDLGGKACLSTRQIEQIENGEMGSFYSAQIKFTAAKKVAKLLKLSDEDAFDSGDQVLTKAIEVASAEEPTKALSETDLEQKEVELIKEVMEEVQAPVLASEEEKEPVKKTESIKVDPVRVASKEIPFPTTSASSKSASSKKLFLGLSVLVALVFSVLNLRPLLYVDKPEEIVAVKEEIIAPVPATNPTDPTPVTPVASTLVAAVPAISAELATACPAEEGIISYKTDVPRKSADMVYVQVKSKQVVCVSDATGKMQNKMIEPSAGASFYGKPPFKVLTGGLAQADVFFQGAKVRLTNLNYKTLILEAAEVVAPSVDRTDSQQR